jgi:hypothetical protein
MLVCTLMIATFRSYETSLYQQDVFDNAESSRMDKNTMA